MIPGSHSPRLLQRDFLTDGRLLALLCESLHITLIRTALSLGPGPGPDKKILPRTGPDGARRSQSNMGVEHHQNQQTGYCLKCRSLKTELSSPKIVTCYEGHMAWVYVAL